jgi:hypothetical protein
MFCEFFFEQLCRLLRLFPRFDSPRRFNPLPSYSESRCLILRTRVDSVGTRKPSEAVAHKLRHAITWIVRSAHGFPDQRGLKIRADVQISGGMRVSDAFPAMDEL